MLMIASKKKKKKKKKTLDGKHLTENLYCMCAMSYDGPGTGDWRTSAGRRCL